MILSSDILKESLSYKKPVKDSIYENASLFTYGLNMIRISNEEMRNTISNIYIESGYNINQSFKESFLEGFSFIDIIKKIIQFFIDTLKSIYMKFKAILSRIMYDDKTILKYQDKIRKYSKEIKYYGEFVRYSHLNDDTPSIKDFYSYFEGFEHVENTLKAIETKYSKDKKEYTRKITDTFNSMTEKEGKKLPDLYDNIRKNMFAKYKEHLGVINRDTFQTAIYNFYRSNSTSHITEIVLKQTDYVEAINRFVNAEKMIKQTEKNRQEVERVTDKNIKKIEKINYTDYFKKYAPVDYDMEYALNNYLKMKTGELQEICNIYTMVYSGKLEAMKEAIKQDKRILFAVVTDLIKKGE